MTKEEAKKMGATHYIYMSEYKNIYIKDIGKKYFLNKHCVFVELLDSAFEILQELDIKPL